MISAIVTIIILSVIMKSLSGIPNDTFYLVINKSYVNPQIMQRKLDLINRVLKFVFFFIKITFLKHA